MDGTQPNTNPDAGVEASTQPVEATPVAAGQTEGTEQQQVSDDTLDWLSKKGFDVANPDSVLQLAKSYRESEKLAVAKAQEASELKKTLSPSEAQPIVPPYGTQSDPMMQEFIQDYRRDKQINAFKDSHEDWQEQEPTMVSLLQEPVSTPYGEYTRSQLVNMGILTLNDVYSMAKGSAPVDTQQIKTQAQQEVLQTLANTQRAGGTTSQASSASPSTPQVTKENVDSWYQGLSQSERALPENQKILSSLL